MRVVGIDISGNTLRWIGLEGQAASGSVFFLATNSLPLPASHSTDAENYDELRRLVVANIRETRVERVGVVKATPGPGVSCERIKCELVVQLASMDLGVECRLVFAQTIAAAEKRKITLATGSNFERAFNGGTSLSPGYLQRAAHCAWTLLP